MLGAVVVSFFVCLLPFRLLTLIEDSEGISPEIYIMLVNFCRIMVYLNSAVNPILYNLMSSKFRNGFLRLFGLKSFARQGTVTSSSMGHTNTTTTSSSAAVAHANASLAHHSSIHRPLHYRLSSQQQPDWINSFHIHLHLYTVLYVRLKLCYRTRWCMLANKSRGSSCLKENWKKKNQYISYKFVKFLWAIYFCRPA